MLASDFIRVDGSHGTFFLCVADVAWVETPGTVGKPCGWIEEYAALVGMRGRSDSIALDAEQWERLKHLMGVS